MGENIHDWSVTAASNANADASINWAENQLPGTVNGSARSVMAALAKFLKDTNGSLSSAGASNAYTLASPNTTYATLTAGLLIAFKASFTNTGAATFNLSAIGAKKILTNDGALYPGQITVNGHYRIEYDTALDGGNGAWLLLNPSPWAGKVRPLLGSTVPDSWVLAYGQAVSRTTYAATFAAYGTTHGVGDGSTTFNLPNLEGRALFGKDNMSGVTAGRITNAESGIVGTTLGATGGAQSVALTTAQLASHSHTVTINAEAAHTHGGTIDNEAGHTHAITVNSSGDHDHAVTVDTYAGSTPAGTISTHSGHTHLINSNTSAASADHTHSSNSPFTTASVAIGSGGPNQSYSNNTATQLNWTTATSSSTSHTHAIFTNTDSGGSHNHTFTGTANQGSHSHVVDIVVAGAHTHTASSGGGSSHGHTITIGSGSSHTHTNTVGSAGGGTSHNNMPPALICNYIIRLV